jgi:hypothetical protein
MARLSEELRKQKAADKARRRRARQKLDPVHYAKIKEYNRNQYLKRKAAGQITPYRDRVHKSKNSRVQRETVCWNHYHVIGSY